MRTDILDMHRFYESPIGACAARFIRRRLREAWGDARGLRLAGFGYATPYLGLFSEAERRINLAPGGQGIIRWPASGANAASLISEEQWPLKDGSLDRVLVVHGLEECDNQRRLMREIWRVLAPDGEVIVVAAHRRGLWSMFDSSPFAAGRPYSQAQLRRLLQGAMFHTPGWSGALYFPPINSRVVLGGARSWERTGARLWPGLSGVILVHATKELAAPIGKLAPEGLRIQRRAGIARPARGGAARKSS